MAFRNVVVINGKKTELKDLDQEERKRLINELSRRAAEKVGYAEDKTA